MSVNSISGTGRSRSKVVTVSKLKAYKSGLQQLFAKKTLVINGQSYKAEAIEQMLQNQIDAMQQVDASHAAWEDAIVTERKGAVSIAELVSGITSFVIATFGTSSTNLAVFGITPRRKPARSVQSKVDAIDQALATRKARRTMGRKQRQAITGVVPASNGAAATGSGASASSTSAPAATPSSNGVGGTHQ
jgi:hypothetical protein